MPNRSLSFTAIDFETASPDRASVCAVGLARVRDSQIEETFSTLVVPPTGLDSFGTYNVRVHGITAERVAGAPTWTEVYQSVLGFVGDDVLVAHNAPFDQSVLERASDCFDLDYLANHWIDTQPLARQQLVLGSYSLPFVARELGLPTRMHHDALEDAVQSALVAVALAERAGIATFDDLWPAGLPGHEAVLRRPEGDWSGIAESEALAGHYIAFTGSLSVLTRKEATTLVESLGAVGQTNVTKKTTIVVTGDFDPATFKPGATMSSKLQQAMDYAASGLPIEILNEHEFFARIEVSKEELARATRAQRAAARSGWLPEYVGAQAKTLSGTGLSYNAWIRKALAHPDGRALPSSRCIRCGVQLAGDLFWLWSERHVCSGDCNDSLKGAAKRAWRRTGVWV